MKRISQYLKSSKDNDLSKVFFSVFAAFSTFKANTVSLTLSCSLCLSFPFSHYSYFCFFVQGSCSAPQSIYETETGQRGSFFFLPLFNAFSLPALVGSENICYIRYMLCKEKCYHCRNKNIINNNSVWWNIIQWRLEGVVDGLVDQIKGKTNKMKWVYTFSSVRLFLQHLFKILLQFRIHAAEIIFKKHKYTFSTHNMKYNINTMLGTFTSFLSTIS